MDVIDEWSRSISRFRGNRYLIARSVKKHAVALGAAAAENVNFIAALFLSLFRTPVYRPVGVVESSEVEQSAGLAPPLAVLYVQCDPLLRATLGSVMKFAHV